MSQDAIKRRVALETAKAELEHSRRQREIAAQAVDQAKTRYDRICRDILDLQDKIIALGKEDAA